MTGVDSEQFFGPVSHVPLFELSLCLFAHDHQPQTLVYLHHRDHTVAATQPPGSSRSPSMAPYLSFDGKYCCTTIRNHATSLGISQSGVCGLNLSTILAFVSSLCVEKWWTPFSFNNAWKERFRNSSPLSICNGMGLILDNNSVNAVTNDDADLFFSGMHHAHFENTSITVSKNVIPSLYFFKFDTSTRSACRLPLRHNAV